MQELERFKSQLKKRWSPPMVVVASDQAEKLCWECNGLTIAELLQPFGTLHKMNGGMGVPIRTPAEQPIRLYDWNLNFRSLNDMKLQPLDVANKHLTTFLAKSACGALEIPEIEQLINSPTVDASSPWYATYSEEFMRMLRFSNHEAVEHPVVCLLVLDSKVEGDISSNFADLFEEKAPLFLKTLVRDSHCIVHYLIVHDGKAEGQDGARERARTALQHLTTTYGPAGHILTINSDSMPRTNPSLWQEFVNTRWEGSKLPEDAPSRTTTAAAGLGQSDLAGITTAIEELAVRKVAPHVESRIRQLDQTALAARKGFKNQLKSMFFRKSTTASSTLPLPATPPSSEGLVPNPGSPRGGSSSPRSPTSAVASQYAYSSVEWQMRQLSDLALMVGDCDTALSTLRLLATDYKADKAYMHYAAVQEAMAVGTVLYDGPPSDAAASFKEAYYRYDQIAQQAQQGPSRATWYATRCAMLMATYLSAINRFSDASWILMKAHFGEEDLRAALLLERAALMLLRVKPAKVRKFAFHMVLAGLRYSKGGAKELAARCYSLAIAVYKHHGWEVVEEHVREALGKGCRENGDNVASLEHFAVAMTCTQIPAGLQSLHLAQFKEALQAATAQLGYTPVIDLPLPIIETSKVEITSSGQTSYANVAARQIAPEVWNVLEAAVGPPPENVANWMTEAATASSVHSSMSRLNLNKNEDLCCCVGEDVGIDVEITNPLQIELAVTKLKLSCTFEGPKQTSAAAPPPAAAPSSPFQLREERITLHPGERTVVHLRVRPLRTGSLQIDGISWELNGFVTGQKPFKISRKRRLKFNNNKSKSSLNGEENCEEPGGISVKVMPPMPRLEITLEDLPSIILVGQLIKCNLKLKNAGAMTLHALRCSIDTPFAYIEFNKASEKPQQVVFSRQGAAVFAAPPGTKLGVNEEYKEITLYLRPTKPGPFSVNLCWHYEPLVKLEALPYRTLRASFSASALPSMELSCKIGSLIGVEEAEKRLLVMRGLNLQGIETFTLKELSLLGGKWRAELAGRQNGNSESGKTVHLGHVVGPEAAIVLHAILSTSTEEASEHEEVSTVEKFLVEGEIAGPRGQQQRKKEVASNEDSSSEKYPKQALLKWKATGIAEGVVQGFNVIKLERAKEGSGFAVRIVGPHTISHDFTAVSACSIPLELQLVHELPGALDIRWGSAVSTTSTAKEKDHPLQEEDEDQSEDKRLQQGQQRFVWTGSSAGTLPDVPLGKIVKVPLRVAVTAPGWVSIDSCWVSWSCKEEPQLSGELQIPPCNVLIVSSAGRRG